MLFNRRKHLGNLVSRQFEAAQQKKIACCRSDDAPACVTESDSKHDAMFVDKLVAG